MFFSFFLFCSCFLSLLCSSCWAQTYPELSQLPTVARACGSTLYAMLDKVTSHMALAGGLLLACLPVEHETDAQHALHQTNYKIQIL
jgi:hypothetical protein